MAAQLRTISAIEVLTRRGVQVLLAKVLIEALLRQPSHPVDVHVPTLGGQKEFASEVVEKFADSDARQSRHEAVSSQLHENIHQEGAASISRDQILERLVRENQDQHQRELDNHESQLGEIADYLKEERRIGKARDRELRELKDMMQSLLGQVKGKGKQSDPTPEGPSAAGGGGGNRNPPPTAAAPGAPDDDDDDDDGDDRGRKGRRDERPASKGRRDERPAQE